MSKTHYSVFLTLLRVDELKHELRADNIECTRPFEVSNIEEVVIRVFSTFSVWNVFEAV